MLGWLGAWFMSPLFSLGEVSKSFLAFALPHVLAELFWVLCELLVAPLPHSLRKVAPLRFCGSTLSMGRKVFGIAILVAVACAGPVWAEENPKAPLAAPIGSPPWLGVSMTPTNDLGVLVEHVVRGSPADKGGIRAGDRIVACDGKRVGAPQEVTQAVVARRVGETVLVEVERSGSALRLSIPLASRPTSDAILRMDLVGAAPPAWTRTAPQAGAPSSLSDLKGNVVVVDFWASWCGPCRMLAPRLSQLRDRYGAQGLRVVGMTTDNAETAATFAERHHMRYPTVVDTNGDTSRAYGIGSLPTMVVVDKKGIVRDVFVGYGSDVDAQLETLIKALLAESVRPAAPAPR